MVVVVSANLVLERWLRFFFRWLRWWEEDAGELGFMSSTCLTENMMSLVMVLVVGAEVLLSRMVVSSDPVLECRLHFCFGWCWWEEDGEELG